MPIYRVRDENDPQGYTIRTEPGELAAAPGQNWMPWALDMHGSVIYAPYDHDKHTIMPGWRRYNSVVSQERRKVCESVLGMIALNHPEMSQPAVDRVSNEILRYFRQLEHKHGRAAIEESVKKHLGKYMFTGGRQNFGRIGVNNVRRMPAAQVYREMLRVLRGGDNVQVEQRIALHERIGAKFLQVYMGPQYVRYTKLERGVREEWMDNPRTRGRAQVRVRPPATRDGGVAPPAAHIGQTRDLRNRGADMFKRDTGRQSSPEGDKYFRDLDQLNLTFGASISGTTGTCFQAAVAFAGLEGEELKQYFFAILGYLVGGGMHTFHESAVIAARLNGFRYWPGTFVHQRTSLLPARFLNSPQCRAWKTAYYDIVVMGARHWLVNANGEQRTSSLSRLQRFMVDMQLRNILNGLAPQG